MNKTPDEPSWVKSSPKGSGLQHVYTRTDRDPQGRLVGSFFRVTSAGPDGETFWLRGDQVHRVEQLESSTAVVLVGGIGGEPSIYRVKENAIDVLSLVDAVTSRDRAVSAGPRMAIATADQLKWEIASLQQRVEALEEESPNPQHVHDRNLHVKGRLEAVEQRMNASGADYSDLSREIETLRKENLSLSVRLGRLEGLEEE